MELLHEERAGAAAANLAQTFALEQLRCQTTHMRDIISHMNTLARILSSRSRASVFELLFGLEDAEVHGRELARRSGLAEATLRQELRTLKELDLVTERRSGNRTYFSANKSHPLYPDIHQLVLKTAGLVEVLAEALSRAGIDIAFVFGSVARSREAGHSDVDLMVIGELGLRKLTARLADLSGKIGRDIHPHVLTRQEYRKRLQAKDHFVTHVLAGPKLFVIGSADDLAAVGE